MRGAQIVRQKDQLLYGMILKKADEYMRMFQ